MTIHMEQQQVDRLDDYLLAIYALRISKHMITVLLWAPRWRGHNNSSKRGTEHKQAQRLHLVLLLRLSVVSILRTGNVRDID